MKRDMRALGRRFIGLVNSLAACAASLFFLLVLLMGGLSGSLDTVRLDMVWPGLVGAGILVLNLLSLIYLKNSAPGTRRSLVEDVSLLSKQGGGSVHVSLQALSQGLMLAGQSVAGLSRLQIKIERPTDRKILITAGFQVPKASPLQELGKKLQEVLSKRFAEMITVDKENQVEYQIVFEGYSGETDGKLPGKGLPAKGIAALGTRKESETPPFTGPRYPVEPGEEG